MYLCMHISIMTQLYMYFYTYKYSVYVGIMCTVCVLSARNCQSNSLSASQPLSYLQTCVPGNAHRKQDGC